MKFSIKRDDFAVALNGIARNSPDEEGGGGHVLLTVAKGELVLVATDKTVTIRRVIPVLNATDGAACLPLRVMKDMMPVLSDDMVRLEHAGRNTTVRCGRSLWNVASLAASSFPAFPRPTGEVQATITASCLVRLLSTVRYAAVASSGSNAAFTAVLLEFNGTHVTAVATDSHRLAKHEEPCSGGVFSVLLPIESAVDLASRIKEDTNIELRHNGDLLSASWGDWEFCTAVIGVPYPDWQRLIETRGELSTVDVPADALKQVIKRAMVMARHSDYPRLALRLGDTGPAARELHVSAAADGTGNVEDMVPVLKSCGTAFDCAVNVRYLAQAIQACGPGNIQNASEGGLRPLRLQNPDMPGMIHIVMPMRAPAE